MVPCPLIARSRFPARYVCPQKALLLDFLLSPSKERIIKKTESNAVNSKLSTLVAFMLDAAVSIELSISISTTSTHQQQKPCDDVFHGLLIL